MSICIGKDTKLIMYDGTFKKVQDIFENDILMGDDLSPIKILTIKKEKDVMYKIIPREGRSYIVNGSHILSLKCKKNFSQEWSKGMTIDISVLEFMQLPGEIQDILIGYKVYIDFPEKSIKYDAWKLGLLLGNTLSCINENYNIQIKKDNYELTDILKEKKIPYIYIYNTAQIRLKLLAGLIDSIGTLRNGYYEIYHENKILKNDVVKIANSLGFYVHIKKIKNKYLISIYGKHIDDIPVRNPRKKTTKKMKINNVLRLEKLSINYYYILSIDKKTKILLNDCTVL